MHVREGHATARRRVAHTRMARRRANQYRAIPGVRWVCTSTVAPAEIVSKPVRGRIHQPHLSPRVSCSRRRLHPFGEEDTSAALYLSTQASRVASSSRYIPVCCGTSVLLEESARVDSNLKKMEIKGRVALVTGAASGIGKAYAIELLNQGAKVAVCDINTEEGEKLVETLTAKYGKDRVIFSQCDVTDYPQFEESFQTTIAEFGHIDIVINNAGIMNDRLWELEVDINLNGVIRGTLLAQRFMGTDRGGQGGIVINTGSNVSINPYVSVPIYSATKAAIVNFTRAFGDQYHVDLTGVKVMTLCPSATESKLVRDVGRKLLLAQYEDAWQRDTASSVPQRAEHVAKALIHVLNTGKSGSVWMVEKEQPPHEINFSKH